MNRDFSILGLREDATKEQVKQAYGRKVAKYRAADFADDPAYANKKIAQLKSAYERAYAIAGTPAVKHSSRETISEPSVIRPVDRPKAYERKKPDYDDFQRGRHKSTDKEESHIRIPDLHKLQNVAKSGTQEIKSALSKKIDDFNRKGDVKAEKAEPYINNSTELTPAPINDTNNWGVVKVIIGIIIAVVVLLTQCGDDGGFIEDEDGYSTEYTFDYTTEQDMQIHRWAEDITDVIYNSDMAASFDNTDYIEEELRKVSDKFAKRYLGTENVEEKASELFSSYEEFPIDDNGDLTEIVSEILAFYGFPRTDDAVGYINKYDDDVITNPVEYLRYLNQYYYYEIRENKKGA